VIIFVNCIFKILISHPFTRIVNKSPKEDSMNNGYLFKEGIIFIPQGSHRKLLIQEMHEGGLMGHFWVTKTLIMLKEKFFWPM